MEGKPVMSDFNAMYLAAHPEMAKKLLQEKRKQLRENRVIVMSIKPKYAKALYEGKKTWEFRKAPPPLNTWIGVYESAPVSAITGLIIFSTMIKGSAYEVYEMAKGCRVYATNHPGITPKELHEYVRGSKDMQVCALRVGGIDKFPSPIKLNVKPPQNWGTYYAPKEGCRK